MKVSWILLFILVVFIIVVAFIEEEGEYVRGNRYIYLDCASDVKAELSVFDAVCLVESNNNERAINEEEDAVGVAQIRPVCVEDCNRILGNSVYSLRDRFDRDKSREMFYIYTDYYMKYYGRVGDEDRCRIWNGGPRGWDKRKTEIYWLKVKEQLSGLRK